MTLPNDLPLQRLQFYVTAPYDCGYLPDRRASSLIAAPQGLVDHQIYDELIRHGFRRSGRYTYRPHCAGCQACVPVRLLIEDFTPLAILFDDTRGDVPDLPIAQLFAPGVPALFVQPRILNAQERLARERFAVEFERQIRFALSKG